jgi:uncharacterized membrane protein
MWTIRELKTRAWSLLSEHYWKAFVVSLVIALAGGSGGGNVNWNVNDSNNGSGLDSWFGQGSEFMLAIILGIAILFIFIILIIACYRIFVGFPLEVGGRKYFVEAEQNHFDMNYLGCVFNKNHYRGVVVTMLWRAWLNFLWFLLFIIPGIIMAYAYRMVPYILADNPNIGYRRAVQLSTQMTQGHKLHIFVLDLSFLGWLILGVLAFFVGVLFVLPYINAANAELYLVLRRNAIKTGYCSEQELLL